VAVYCIPKMKLKNKKYKACEGRWEEKKGILLPHGRIFSLPNPQPPHDTKGPVQRAEFFPNKLSQRLVS